MGWNTSVSTAWGSPIGTCKGFEKVKVPIDIVSKLQHLTFLQLAWVEAVGPDEGSPALQPLHALTRLQDLRLECLEPEGKTLSMDDTSRITASMLSGTHHLTRLELSGFLSIAPEALSGTTSLAATACAPAKPQNIW
jgi:hypothetical protein